MGDLKLNGSTSGTITVTPTAVAGTNTITLPASTGTVALTASPTFTGTVTIPTLSVTSNETVGGTLSVTGASTLTGTVTATTITSPASTALTIQSAGTTAMTVSTGQNVGIGTTSPTTSLDVNGTITSRCPSGGTGLLMRGRSSDNLSQVIAYDNTSTTLYGLLQFGATGGGTVTLISQGATGTTNFWTNGSERMRIDSNGVLLVGTTSTFDVTSAATTQLSGQCAVYNSGSPNTLMSFYNSTQSARVGYIGSSGNSTTYYSGSDYRLKDNVTDINGALSTISAMRPVTFTWKISPETGVFSGFIAHELQEICPEAVGGAKDAMCDDGVTPNYQMVDQSKLVPLLVAAVQELSAKNDALEARLAALEAK